MARVVDREVHEARGNAGRAFLLGYSTILLGADLYAYRLQEAMDATALAVDDVLADASITDLRYSDDDAEDPVDGR